MALFWIVGALAIASVAGALLFQARKIKARHRRFAAAAPVVAPDGTRLIDAPRALYHGTGFMDGTALLFPEWMEPCVCDLWCTEEAVFIQREAQGALLAIPLKIIDEATLHRGWVLLAEAELPILRLRWTRGGEMLATEVSLRGGIASLETLRREIHLRQGNIAAQLAPLLQRMPP